MEYGALAVQVQIIILHGIIRGNTEKINDVTDTWFKVKTEKGEVGWCFDAYLEEIK